MIPRLQYMLLAAAILRGALIVYGLWQDSALPVAFTVRALMTGCARLSKTFIKMNARYSKALAPVALSGHRLWRVHRRLALHDGRQIAGAPYPLASAAPGTAAGTAAARGCQRTALAQYLRDTYRYPPILAALLMPNVWLHPTWGKWLFCAADLLNGWMTVQAPALADELPRICSATPAPPPAARRARRAAQHRRAAAQVLETLGCSPGGAALCAAVGLFNPFMATISARGSCDALILAALLGMVLCLLRTRVAAGGAIYGLAGTRCGEGSAVLRRLCGAASLAPARARAKHLQSACSPLPGVSGHLCAAHHAVFGPLALPSARPQSRGAAPRAAPPFRCRGPALGAACGFSLRLFPAPDCHSRVCADPEDEGHQNAPPVRHPALPRLRRRAPPGRPAPPALQPAGSSAACRELRLLTASAAAPCSTRGAALSFLALSGGSAALYGKEFMQQTYWYHLKRQDTRHNFAPEFYLNYLQVAGRRAPNPDAEGDLQRRISSFLCALPASALSPTPRHSTTTRLLGDCRDGPTPCRRPAPPAEARPARRRCSRCCARRRLTRCFQSCPLSAVRSPLSRRCPPSSQGW